MNRKYVRNHCDHGVSLHLKVFCEFAFEHFESWHLTIFDELQELAFFILRRKPFEEFWE